MALTLGLDVSSEAVRGVLVRTAFRRIELLACIEAKSLRELIGMLPALPQRVVVAIEASELSLRLVELPTAAMRRVAQVLPFEMESLIPFSAQEVIIDHQPVHEDATTTRLLVAAAPRSALLRHLQTLREDGVEAAEMAVAPAALGALSALCPQLLAKEPSLLLLVDAHRSEFCLLADGRVQFARSFGSEAQGWSDALRQSVAACRHAGSPAPACVWLVGSQAMEPHVAAACRSVLGDDLPVQPLPWGGVGAEEPVPWQRFALALALAWRPAARGKPINLLRGELAPRRMVSQARRYLGRIALCSALVVGSMLFYLFVRWSQLRDENTSLRTQLSSLTDRYFDQPTTDAVQATRLVEEGRSSVGPLPSFDALDALDVLSKEIPASIKHDTRRLTVEVGSGSEEGSIELQGTIDSIADRDAIVARLEKQPCFHGLETGKTATVPGTERLSYAVTAVLHCGKRRGKVQSRKGRGR